ARRSPGGTRSVRDRAGSEPQPAARAAAELDQLTEREIEVLELVATGASNAEIAGRLFGGEATLKTHVSNLLTKLDLRDRIHAVIWAYEHGIATIGRREDTL